MLSGSLYFDRGQIIKCSISFLAIFILPEEKHIYLWQLSVFLLPWREGRRELVTPLSFQSNLWLYVNRYFLWYSSYHGKTVIWILHVTSFPFCFSFLSLPYKMSPISVFFALPLKMEKKNHQWKKPSQFRAKVWANGHLQDATYCSPISPVTYVVTYRSFFLTGLSGLHK